MLRTLPRFDFRVRFEGASETGLVRQNNEDVWHIEPDLALFLVSDGMGGHAAGEVAAATCAHEFVDALKTKSARRALDAYVALPSLERRHGVFEHLRNAVVHANKVVRSKAQATPAFKGMGCTLDAVLLLRDRGFVIHVGDGRVYLSRVATTIQLTHDHGLNDSLVMQGKASLRDSQKRHNPLINAVGLRDEISADCVFVDLTRGDRVLLCSDGLYSAFHDESALGAALRQDHAEKVVHTLLATSLDKGGRDNATAIVLEIGDRFVQRASSDSSAATSELFAIRSCPLFADLADGPVLRALAAAVEVEFTCEEDLPRMIANDRVSYVVIDGELLAGDGRTLGPSALVYPESLVDAGREGNAIKAKSRVRALRLRADDFSEVCDSDAALAAALYQRLARHLARRGDW